MWISCLPCCSIDSHKPTQSILAVREGHNPSISVDHLERIHQEAPGSLVFEYLISISRPRITQIQNGAKPTSIRNLIGSRKSCESSRRSSTRTYNVNLRAIHIPLAVVKRSSRHKLLETEKILARRCSSGDSKVPLLVVSCI